MFCESRAQTGVRLCECTCASFLYLDSRRDSVLGGALAVLWRGADVRLSQSWQRRIVSHGVGVCVCVCALET